MNIYNNENFNCYINNDKIFGTYEPKIDKISNINTIRYYRYYKIQVKL